ncbi:hypothetical protein R1flu_003847 [Riccia fluitans]|uniref:Transmembrane protein n=1 Tax=Riccia fluitans TaxID=41844 RepID=A0ABD1YDL2_9MARC
MPVAHPGGCRLLGSTGAMAGSSQFFTTLAVPHEVQLGCERRGSTTQRSDYVARGGTCQGQRLASIGLASACDFYEVSAIETRGPFPPSLIRNFLRAARSAGDVIKHSPRFNPLWILSLEPTELTPGWNSGGELSKNRVLAGGLRRSALPQWKDGASASDSANVCYSVFGSNLHDCLEGDEGALISQVGRDSQGVAQHDFPPPWELDEFVKAGFGVSALVHYFIIFMFLLVRHRSHFPECYLFRPSLHRLCWTPSMLDPVRTFGLSVVPLWFPRAFLVCHVAALVLLRPPSYAPTR